MKRRACVIGWPIKHSRSPLIHGNWLKRFGIDGDYCKEAVPPADFAEFVGNLSKRGYVGANVTVPHKEAALMAAARPDAAATAIGAANTLWLRDGVLHATNSDASGFLDHLQSTVPDWFRPQRPVVVVGAGGAARAIIYALLARGVGSIELVNRTPQRAEALAAFFGGGVTVRRWSDIDRALATAFLLVNTTTLGMSGHPPLEIDLAPLPTDAAVYDIVYTPLRTALLAAAERRGLATVDGLGMLLHQAVPGFQLWFGVRPPVDVELRRLVEADILNPAG